MTPEKLTGEEEKERHNGTKVEDRVEVGCEQKKDSKKKKTRRRRRKGTLDEKGEALADGWNAPPAF